jgi:hypothetical protein
MSILLKQKVDAQLNNEKREQTQLYENTVGIVIDKTKDPEKIAVAYNKYQTNLRNFNPAAFRKTLNILRTDVAKNDPEKYANLASEFKAIPEYINHRNNFNEKRKELLNTNGSNQDKQAMFDTLDRQRLKAHNGVIMLFNNMNDLADENKVASPYPNNGEPFDKNDPLDREKVADVLTRHEPVLDTVNKFMIESLNELKLESPEEKLKRMNLKQLAEYAMTHQPKKHQQIKKQTKDIDLEM